MNARDEKMKVTREMQIDWHNGRVAKYLLEEIAKSLAGASYSKRLCEGTVISEAHAEESRPSELSLVMRGGHQQAPDRGDLVYEVEYDNPMSQDNERPRWVLHDQLTRIDDNGDAAMDPPKRYSLTSPRHVMRMALLKWHRRREK